MKRKQRRRKHVFDLCRRAVPARDQRRSRASDPSQGRRTGLPASGRGAPPALRVEGESRQSAPAGHVRCRSETARAPGRRETRRTATSDPGQERRKDPPDGRGIPAPRVTGRGACRRPRQQTRLSTGPRPEPSRQLLLKLTKRAPLRPSHLVRLRPCLLRKSCGRRCLELRSRCQWKPQSRRPLRKSLSAYPRSRRSWIGEGVQLPRQSPCSRFPHRVCACVTNVPFA